MMATEQKKTPSIASSHKPPRTLTTGVSSCTRTTLTVKIEYYVLLRHIWHGGHFNPAGSAFLLPYCWLLVEFGWDFLHCVLPFKTLVKKSNSKCGLWLSCKNNFLNFGLNLWIKIRVTIKNVEQNIAVIDMLLDYYLILFKWWTGSEHTPLLSGIKMISWWQHSPFH